MATKKRHPHNQVSNHPAHSSNTTTTSSFRGLNPTYPAIFPFPTLGNPFVSGSGDNDVDDHTTGGAGDNDVDDVH